MSLVFRIFLRSSKSGQLSILKAGTFSLSLAPNHYQNISFAITDGGCVLALSSGRRARVRG